MSEWGAKLLGEISKILIGGTPSRVVESYWEKEQGHGHPWVAISDLKGRYVTTTAERITEQGVLNSNVKLVKAGTIIMSFKLSIGRIAFAKINLYTNEAIASFIVDPQIVDSEFLYYQLPEVACAAITDTAVKGATLNKEKLTNLVVPLPSLKTQQKIAKILTTVDNLIDKTQALIDKYSAIKQGMMTDLFTRGIDLSGSPETNPNYGQLRPSVEDRPELYKQTEIGMVPKDWIFDSLASQIKGNGFVQTGPFGSQLHSYEYVEHGVPVVMPQDIDNGQISLQKVAKITSVKAASLSRHLLKDNDVVFSRRGDLTRSSYISFENKNVGFLCGTGCLLLRIDPANIHGGWFSMLYGTRVVQSQVEGLAVGSTMANLNSRILGKLCIAFPCIEEQRAVFNRIHSLDSELDIHNREVVKLKKVKKGLMQDLLTGKVRVN